MINIVEEIFRRADRNALALIAGEQRLHFGELESLVERAAALLGPKQGRRLGLLCPNGVHHIVWSLAVLKCGGILAPVPGELSVPERDALAKTTRLHGVLVAGGKTWRHDTAQRAELELTGMPATFHSFTPEAPDFDEATLLALNPALIRFSSGTTGKSKGVVLSHQTLLDRVTACNAGLKIGPGDRVIWTLPMAHHFAVSIVLYLLHGATTVLEDSHLGADVWRALSTHEGTVLYGSPFHYALLGAHGEAKPLPSLRLAVSTAAALSQQVAEQFKARLGLPLTQGMGIIEVGLPLLNVEHAADLPESVGVAQPSFEAKIVVPQTQGEPAAGEAGELWLRGPGVFDAYLSPWTPREAVLREGGWFVTGDLARKDEGGRIYLVGRTHSVINVGGMKAFPEEIEAVLRQHPGVAEARVVAMTHATFGAVPAAEIVPKDPAAPPKNIELNTLCRSQLSNYKIPLKYTLVAALPKTPSGKILR